MTVNIISNEGMKSFSGAIRLVFDGDLFPVDTTVEELRGLFHNPLPNDKKKKSKLSPQELEAAIKSFTEFYSRYGKKQKKQEALAAWMKLTQADHAAILKHVDGFVKTHADVQYRPLPASYLNGRRWEDDDQQEGCKKEIPSWAKRNTWEQ